MLRRRSSSRWRSGAMSLPSAGGRRGPVFCDRRSRCHRRHGRQGARHGAYRWPAPRARHRRGAALPAATPRPSCQSSMTIRSPTSSPASRWRTSVCPRCATLADYTFHFKHDETRRILGTGAATAAAAAAAPGDTGKPLILLPVFQSTGGATAVGGSQPVAEAWEQMPAAAGPVRLVVPLGDAGDLAAIDADKARAGDSDALAADHPPQRRRRRARRARRPRAGLRTVRTGSMSPSGITSAGRLADSHVERVERQPRRKRERAPAPRCGRNRRPTSGAAGRTRRPRIPIRRAALTAILPITSLDDWVRAKERIVRRAGDPQDCSDGLVAAGGDDRDRL